MKVLEGIEFIERGYLNANHFVCRSGGEITLVDTGYVGSLGQTLSLLKEAGVEPSAVSRIINTHCHCDHVGGNGFIQRASGCQVMMHSVGRDIITRRDDTDTWWGYFEQEGEFFDCAGALEDGDVVELGGHGFEVVHLPGHSRDLIALYNRSGKVLISSDALWETDMAVITQAVEGEDAPQRWLTSLEKLEGLDVAMVFPGHGKPFSDLPRALHRIRSRLEHFMADPERMGTDLLRKIVVYTLMMYGPMEVAAFRQRLLTSRWFTETVERYFGGDDEGLYRRTVASLIHKGVVKEENGQLNTSVKK